MSEKSPTSKELWEKPQNQHFFLHDKSIPESNPEIMSYLIIKEGEINQ